MSQKKKVVFFINTFLIGGIEKVLIEYIKNINKEKFEVSLVIGLNMGDAQVLIQHLPKEVPFKYLVNSKLVNHYKIKKALTLNKLSFLEKIIESALFSPIGRVIYAMNIKRLLENQDVVVDFGFSYKLPKLRIPIISFMHFSLKSYLNWDIDPQSTSYSSFLKQIEQRAMVVTLNEEMKNEVREYFPNLIEKFTTIYNPFDLAKIDKLSKQPLEMINRTAVVDGYILSVCRLEEGQKDVSCLIKAFNILVKEYHYSGNLVIVGDGKSLGLLQNLAESLDISKRIYFEGFKDNTLNYMKNSDIFVLSSKYEGLPGVLIEALAVGVPVISSDCPTGPREILQNGNAGLLFEIGNYRQLSILLKDLLANANLKDQLISNGQRRSLDFSIESNVTKLEDILCRLSR